MDRQLFECIDPSSRDLSTICSLGKGRRFSAVHWSTASRSVPIVCGQDHRICRHVDSQAWSFVLHKQSQGLPLRVLFQRLGNGLPASRLSYKLRQRNELHFVRVSFGKQTEACNAWRSENFGFHRRTNIDERLGASIRPVTCFRALYIT
jgi:hypothetical protein